MSSGFFPPPDNPAYQIINFHFFGIVAIKVGYPFICLPDCFELRTGPLVWLPFLLPCFKSFFLDARPRPNPYLQIILLTCPVIPWISPVFPDPA